ncbi:ABC transporter permease [Paenibacillus harenae]|uniref:Transport permease protein n=1 Tax=Paenibacillus harenae TaxID=306543 RepID=A0ABT9U6G9_PAEHA|nr:ABC transporter permease [Paenibacillus harenae]MDQ0115231.1 teichoic acid transport system permease protein [Paenibacillus harenae]
MQLLKDFWRNRGLIWGFAKNDFRTRFSGSLFGITWAFVQPVMTILTLWFVFQIGFRTPAVHDVPFILWFAAGMIPWFFFSDGWSSAGNAFSDYSYLIKKVVFKVSMLPLIKIISSVFIHVVFIAFLFLIYGAYGYYPELIWIQLLYYSFCMGILVLTLAFITSTIAPFFKDINNIVAIVLQFGMWLTPIMWPYTMVADKYQKFFKLNPMYYIVEGYRDTLINHVWFWNRFNQTTYFWLLCFVLLVIGALLYKKLKPHFADVL